MFEGYSITNELASTAVSRVLLGESLSLTAPRQRVVIKWFPTTYLTTRLEIEHFLQEVSTLSRLLHPFILPVFSAGFVENTPYIVEAYASKGSLQGRLQNAPGQPFPLEEAFTILSQIGQALSYVHQCDITHGNLKPQNILFNDKGDVLLADFFLPTLVIQPNNIAVSGSSEYQAPELLTGCTGQQSDQYALGCIAYEMVTGHKPFMTPSLTKPGISYRTKSLIPPKHFNPAISLLCEEAILKAIAKEPAQRHRNIESFLTALGILTTARNWTTSTVVAPLPLASDPSEQASPVRVPTQPFGTDSLKPFFRRRWVRVVFVCLAAVCIIAVSFLSFSSFFLSPSGQEHTGQEHRKTMPGIGVKIEPSSPALANTPGYSTTPISSTHTPGAVATPKDGLSVTPLPTSTSTATVQPISTPTLNPVPTPTPIPRPTQAPKPTPTPQHCLLLFC